MFDSYEAIKTLEQTLGMGEWTLIDLFEERDQDLIIICHALTEAAVLDQSVSRAPAVQFGRVLKRLDKRDYEPRRLRRVDTSGLKSTSQRTFFRGLTDLRNEVATAIRSAGYPYRCKRSWLDAYVARLGTYERKRFANKFARTFGFGIRRRSDTGLLVALFDR